MHESVAVTLSLPDNRQVLQRRDLDAPSSRGMLAYFGGGVEDIDPLRCRHHAAVREVLEELGSDVDMEINHVGDLLYVSQVYDLPILRISVYAGRIASMPKVLEGQQAEAFYVEELFERPDVANSTRAIITCMTNASAGLEQKEHLWL